MAPTSTIGGPMEFTLRLIGVWPDSSCKFLQRVLWATTMATWLLFQYWYLFSHIGSNTLPDLLDSLSLCLSNSLLFLKLSILWLNGGIICNIFATMAEDWIECASKDTKIQTMIDKAILSHRVSKYTIGAYTACLVFFGTGDMLAQKNAASKQQLVEEKQLIVKMNLPFEYGTSPFYEIILVIQFFVQCTLAILAGMLNVLIATLVFHIAGQIDIMCHELLKISVTENKYDSRIIKLRSIVSRHQRIIAFADNIEDVFCYMLLMQILLGTFITCFLGFIIVTSFDSADRNSILVKVIPYYFFVNAEAFVPCFTGEYLSSKSKSISQAACDTNWYELKPTESRILLILIVRSQRQLTVTVGKFMDLSLESFTSILKTSASYVSVLHAMY